MQREGLFKLANVVVLKHQRVLYHLRRHTGAGRVAKGGEAGAGLDQKRISMAVVTALKLDQLVAPGGATGQADGTHGGLGARADQANHVHGGHQLEDRLGQFYLPLGWCTK